MKRTHKLFIDATGHAHDHCKDDQSAFLGANDWIEIRSIKELLSFMKSNGPPLIVSIGDSVNKSDYHVDTSSPFKGINFDEFLKAPETYAEDLKRYKDHVAHLIHKWAEESLEEVVKVKPSWTLKDSDGVLIAEDKTKYDGAGITPYFGVDPVTLIKTSKDIKVERVDKGSYKVTGSDESLKSIHDMMERSKSSIEKLTKIEELLKDRSEREDKEITRKFEVSTGTGFSESVLKETGWKYTDLTSDELSSEASDQRDDFTKIIKALCEHCLMTKVHFPLFNCHSTNPNIKSAMVDLILQMPKHEGECSYEKLKEDEIKEDVYTDQEKVMYSSRTLYPTAFDDSYTPTPTEKYLTDLKFEGTTTFEGDETWPITKIIKEPKLDYKGDLITTSKKKKKTHHYSGMKNIKTTLKALTSKIYRR